MGPADDPRPRSGGLASAAGSAPSRITVVTLGLSIGVLEVFFVSSYAALIFRGALADHLSTGVGLLLGGSVFLLSLVSLRSSAAGAIAHTQDATAVVFALAAAEAARRAPAGEAAFATAVAGAFVVTTATGVLFFGLGRLRLAALVRFVPYPVIAGFLAGVGWLLVVGAVRVADPAPFGWDDLDRLAELDGVVRYAPALLFALLFLVVVRRARHVVALPAAIVAGVAGWYAVLGLTGTSLDAARDRRLLLGPLPEGVRWEVAVPAALGDADWSSLAQQTGTFATLAAVAVLAILVNVSAIELANRWELDANVELRAAGLANVAAGVVGGLPGYHSISLSSLGGRFAGRGSRAAGLIAAGVCVATLVGGGPLVELLPRALIAGLVLFLGVSLVAEWAIATRRSLPSSDHVVVLLILGAVVLWGFLVAVAVGTALAVVLFLVRYSRVDPLRRVGTGTARRSNVDRLPAQAEVLAARGDATLVLELDGFLFFGSAHRVVDHVRSRAADASRPLRFAVLDFRRVTGLDSSATAAFVRLGRHATLHGYELVLSDVPPRLQRDLERAVRREADGLPLRGFTDLDHALEWCEERLLEDVAPEPSSGLDGVARFGRYLQRIDLEAGQQLMREEDGFDGLYLVEAGALTVARARRTGGARLRRIGPGSVVGEIALFLGQGRSASVVSDEPSIVYRLSLEALAAMERDEPRLAVELHRLLAARLAARVVDAGRAQQELRD